jgi:hypothetical protein
MHLVKPVDFEQLLVEIERQCPATAPAVSGRGEELVPQV